MINFIYVSGYLAYKLIGDTTKTWASDILQCCDFA